MAVPATTSWSAAPTALNDDDVDLCRQLQQQQLRQLAPAQPTGSRTGSRPTTAAARPAARSGSTMATTSCASIGGDGAHQRRARSTRTVNLAARDDGHAHAIDYDADGLDAGENRHVSVRGQWRRLFDDFRRSTPATDGSGYTTPSIGPFTANGAYPLRSTAISAARRECRDRQPRHQLHDGHGSAPALTPSTAASATTPTRSASVTATTSSTKASAPQRRHGGSDLDPCAEHGRSISMTLLPILTINALNAFDSNTGTRPATWSSTTRCRPAPQQTITVAGHFDGTTAETGVERINFNGATYQGLPARRRRLSDQPARRQPRCRRRQPLRLARPTTSSSASKASNDIITGGSGNDLIFGGTGDNDLVGGLGDDLLVGGSGSDDLTPD